MLVFLLGPGKVRGPVFSPIPLQAIAPSPPRSPSVGLGRPQGAWEEWCALAGPAFQGSHHFCPHPPSRDESELAIVLNRHILGLTQSLPEQVLSDRVKLQQEGEQK